MRLAILSDIHGNAIAFDAVLADMRDKSLDQLVCLGDAIQGGAQPAEVVERLDGLGCPVVMGNADDFLLHGEIKNPGESISPAQLAVRDWQLARLAPAAIQFIQSFQPTIELSLGAGRTLLCFHGSPRSFNDIIFPHTPEDEFQRYLGPVSAVALCGGHTHLQMLRRHGDALFFNPGSIGLACDNRRPRDENFRADPWAEYAIFTVDGPRLALEFRRVPFDVAAWLRVIRDSGRPDADASFRLYEGRTSFS